MNKLYRQLSFFFLLIIVFFHSERILAQDLLRGNDLSRVKVEMLSDNDIIKLKSQLKRNNMTIESVESTALSKGMSPAEFSKLKDRVNNADSNPSSNNNPKKKKSYEGDKDKNNENSSESKNDDGSTRKNNKSYDGSRNQNDLEEINNKKQSKDTIDSRIFGSELFNNAALTFEPNLKLATPLNYILGPGDELQVNVYGVQEYSDVLPVSVEGKITIQNVGQINVGGLTFEAASQNIKQAISRVYSTVNYGQSQVAVSLSSIRTIKVTIIGSMQPGNYSVSSLATVYNVLHLAGGPGKNGSYRNIELIRNNKLVRTIDIYRFLVNGDQTDNLGLKDNDVIRIPAYHNRVTVEGEVKRPGFFEVLPTENFSDLLKFASGFTENAYRASVNVVQKTNKELKVVDVLSSDFDTYKPQSGDAFTVSKILNRYENRVTINGSVFRPNNYSLREGMTILDLIAQADGLTEDAYSSRARLVRLKPDLTKEIVDVNLEKVLAGDSQYNVILKKEDELTIYSIFDLRDDFSVTIDGEVRKPGEYDYVENLSLNDLLIQAGGLSDAASKRVEIARMIKSEDIDPKDPKKVQLFNIEITPTNNEQSKVFILEPYDIVNVRKLPVFEKPEMITISGEVLYPGKYVIVNKKEKIFNFIQRAGGLSPEANPNGIKIKRLIVEKDLEGLKNVKLDLKDNDSIQEQIVKEVQYATIPIDWEKVRKNKKNYSNVTLLPGDEIEVAAFEEGVKVLGNVLLTSEIPYRKGKGVDYYISSVGGTNSKAWKRKTYVVYPNGSAATAHGFMFIRSYPKVTPGSQIVVPERPERKGMSTGEVVSLASVLASLAGVIIAIIR